jgi:CheY-like chemotaxis protein/two-component sensor histidine kinase
MGTNIHAAPESAGGSEERFRGSGPVEDVNDSASFPRDLPPPECEPAADESSQRMQLFLAMLAHELRNPLAPLRNAVRVMYMDPTPEPHIAWARDIIDRQVSQLARLVDELLDVGRIKSGKIYLDRARIEIAAVVHQAVESCQPLFAERQQELTVQLGRQPLWVDGDLLRLSQAVLNLLSNASKFTPAGGHIQVTAKQQDGQVELTVADTGVGISKELLPSVFDLFVQGDPSLDRMSGGLGVGLTLVKEIVTMHGGSIAAKSSGPNLGSEFTVRLPQFVESDPAAGASQKRSEVPGAATHRILVVDDNRDSAETMAMLLQIGGHTVHVAFDGPSALPAVREFQPEVVLLDLGLPGLTGYEVAKKVQEMELTLRPLLVAMTGYGQQGDRQRTRAAGFDHHLVKPVDLEMLQQILRSVPSRADAG